MSWDIYGNKLEPGHCEVHPWVPIEYPCPTCVDERRSREGVSPEQLNRKLREISIVLAELRGRIEKLEQR